MHLFQSEAYDYAVEKRLKNTYHIDSNDQRLLMPKDGNQCAPNSSPLIDENTLQQLENALIPDVDAASNDESQHISTLMNEKQNNVAPVDVDAQSADTVSLLDGDDIQVQEAVVEEQNLTERQNSTQLSSDPIQVSADMAKLHAVDSSQELRDHDEISDNDPSSGSKTDEESIVPDVHTCDKDKDGNSNERAVDCVLAEDNSNILETQDDTPLHDDDDFTILSTGGSSRMDEQQTQTNVEIVLSEGYKKPDIELSEGYRKPDIELSEGLFKRPNKITLIERMVN
jgi:hypothetical protein